MRYNIHMLTSMGLASARNEIMNHERGKYGF